MNLSQLSHQFRALAAVLAIFLPCFLALACQFRPHVDSPSCSPDIDPSGGAVLFAAPGTDDSADIYKIDIDGTRLERIIADPAQDYYGQWSHDGASIYFVSERGKRPNIYCCKPSGDDVAAVTDQRRLIGAPMPSPGGFRLAYPEHAGETRRVMIYEAGQYHELKAQGVYPTPIDWLDTDTLAYDCTDKVGGTWVNQIRTFNFSSKRDEVMWQNGNADALYIVISRDASTAAWIEFKDYKYYRVVVENLASKARKTFLHGSEKLWSLDISGDGRFIVILRSVIEAPPVRTGILSLVDVETGKVSDLIDTRGEMTLSD